ncbi:hypothetical protein N7492_008437 [Penicillium capsulatum]|uniref:VanZ-like domain-containing protein n=1 Tax=Penicillium capsulatum TaxID=69766 RepID=A0A9W9HSN6_9EURO|nr:hypothetical protein N7492_008437 [Penicillium capsulatum]KAJ6105839.1 hypothetical protein N7512_009356 [Penicillium capsulatum]
MRIRYPFAGGFVFLLLVAGWGGLLSHTTGPQVPSALQLNDKFIHLITFFLLTLAFYWIFDTSRRRIVHITLVGCTLGLSIGSEILQGLLPNDRPFDLYDAVANVVGSLGAVALCSFYHRRMLERRRKSRYGMVDGASDDVELGVNVGGSSTHRDEGLGAQESGVMNLEHEVDNWDENAVDNWDTEDGPEPSAPPSYHEDQKARGQDTEGEEAVKHHD